jgi:hypothetical protein
LSGKTQCFTFYTPPTDHIQKISVKHKIRFIAPTFAARLESIRREDPLEQMAKLCKLIVNELAACEVALAVKEGGKRQLIVSESLRERLKAGEVVIKNKQGDAKEYKDEEITTKTESFFQGLASSFTSHIDAILKIDAQLKLQELEEKEEKKRAERKVSLFSFSFTSFMSHLWTSLFGGGSSRESAEVTKIFRKSEESEREHRLMKEKSQRLADERRQDDRRQDRLRENIKFDIQRFERNREEDKSSRRRQELKSPRSSPAA